MKLSDLTNVLVVVVCACLREEREGGEGGETGEQQHDGSGMLRKGEAGKGEKKRPGPWDTSRAIFMAALPLFGISLGISSGHSDLFLHYNRRQILCL